MDKSCSLRYTVYGAYGSLPHTDCTWYNIGQKKRNAHCKYLSLKTRYYLQCSGSLFGLFTDAASVPVFVYREFSRVDPLLQCASQNCSNASLLNVGSWERLVGRPADCVPVRINGTNLVQCFQFLFIISSMVN